MTSSPTSSEPRRKSSVSPVISSYVLAPETPAAELRKESGPTTRYIGTGSGSPLVHHYRLASSDNPLRMRRSASVRANSNPRPVLLDSSVSSRDAEVPTVASQDASGHRRLEYRLFLLAMSSVTLMVALLQPLLLYRSLVPCTEPRCFSVALPVREALQASVSPCADFFRYSCSGIDSGFSEKVRHSLRLSTLSLISELPASPGQSAVRKAGILLRSCLRLVNQKPEDIDGIRHVLKIGGLRFPALPQTSTSSVLRGVVDLNLHLGIAVLFRLTVGRDLKHRGHHMLYLARNDDLAGFVRYLGRLEASQSLDDYVRRCAEVIGERGMSYARLIDAVRQTNRRFVLTLDDVVDGGPVFYAPPTQVGAFWTGIFKGLQSEFRNLPNVSKELFVLHSNYFNALDEIFLQQLEPRLLSAYVGLYVVWYLSRLGSHSLAYHISVQGYTSGLKDVWTRCFSDVYRLMPLAIERLYLEGHLKADDVHEMEDMLRRITHATGVFLASLDRNTGRLQTRLASLGLFAFGAQSTRALGDVDRLYDHVPDQRDEAFLDGFLNASRSTAQHARHLLRIPAEAQGGPFLPPFLAELPHMAGVHHLIPLGPDAVTPPAFTFDQSPTLNYAGLGGRIGAQRTTKRRDAEVSFPGEAASAEQAPAAERVRPVRESLVDGPGERHARADPVPAQPLPLVPLGKPARRRRPHPDGHCHAHRVHGLLERAGVSVRFRPVPVRVPAVRHVSRAAVLRRQLPQLVPRPRGVGRRPPRGQGQGAGQVPLLAHGPRKLREGLRLQSQGRRRGLPERRTPGRRHCAGGHNHVAFLDAPSGRGPSRQRSLLDLRETIVCPGMLPRQVTLATVLTRDDIIIKFLF
ncbi:endothelin-converting enzyme homolog isoform X1 [Ixodes scapularis]|uniref:endothelin-converting enzyme homolog isoform X1 n=1 Tax=Ixodes scapularis TaxID=6945 RepID=UPI001C37EB25|nr:endothelin-converting enzyme homolog isoform X1 [Ixodes scapularis]